MNASTRPEQTAIDGLAQAADDKDVHMIARVSAVAVKIVFPFIAAASDVRHYLAGVNIRPLEDGSAMAIATDGHRYIVVRDPNGFAEHEITVGISKDALKHAASAKHTLDIMSNGVALVSGPHSQPLFIQPGNAFVEGEFPRIERVASLAGYREGITGAVNPKYLNDALAIGKSFGDSIRFFTKDATSPLTFLLGGLGDLECFGGIMKLDRHQSLPDWFPAPGMANSVGQL